MIGSRAMSGDAPRPLRSLEGAAGLNELTVPETWWELLDTLEDAAGTVMVVGGVDTGKTVLCWWLAEQLSARAPTGIIDSDLGQSVLGPPGTVGWRMVGEERTEFIFVGAVTPARRPLGTVTATWRACTRAGEAGAAWRVLDTSGYVDGPGAAALKRAKLDLVHPTDVVLIEDHPDRLAAIARAITPGEVRVHRLAPVPAVQARSTESRRRWRRERFREYLAEAIVQRISLAGRAVYGGRPWVWGPRWRQLEPHLRGLLVGLSDAEGVCRAIGLLQAVEEKGETLVVLAPPVDEEQIAAVDLGTVRLHRDGTQITAPAGRTCEGEAMMRKASAVPRANIEETESHCDEEN